MFSWFIFDDGKSFTDRMQTIGSINDQPTSDCSSCNNNSVGDIDVTNTSNQVFFLFLGIQNTINCSEIQCQPNF